MESSITIAIVIMFFYLLGITVFWLKLKPVKNEEMIKTQRKTNIFPKELVGMLGLFSIVFLFAFMRSPYNLPPIFDVSSEYNDLVDVGDGIVVVGRTRKAVSDPNRTNSTHDTTRAYIVKYDYDGKIIWDDVRYIEDKVNVSSSYSSIDVDEFGNLIATGIFGGYYDGYSLWDVTYSPEGNVLTIENENFSTPSSKPHFFNDDSVLRFYNKMLNNAEDINEIEIILSSDDETKHARFDLIYQHEIISTYNTWRPRIDVVYEDVDNFVLGLSVYNMNNQLVFNQLYVFDYALNLINNVNLSDNIPHGKIQKQGNQFYMLSRDDVNRLSHLVILDNAFEEQRIVPVKSDLNHFMANTMLIEDNMIYVGGNEYETRTKKGSQNTSLV